MFFALSKILAFFAVPSNLLFLIAAVGVVLMVTRFARAGRGLAVLGVRIARHRRTVAARQCADPAARAAFPGVGCLARRARRHRHFGRRRIGPSHVGCSRGEPVAQRIRRAHDCGRRSGAALSQRAHPVQRRRRQPDGRQQRRGEVRAAAVRELRHSAAKRIELEGKSRNTAENATFSKALANPKPGERWLLVTSAHHMPRSVGCFRRAGFAVEAYPVDWRTRGAADLATPFGGLAARPCAHRRRGPRVGWAAGLLADAAGRPNCFPRPN